MRSIQIPPKAMTKSLEAIRTLEVLKARTSALIPVGIFNQFRRAARTFLNVRFGRQKRTEGEMTREDCSSS
jgi:hypothetical protein